MGDDTPQRWTVVARNLVEHAGNRIHTDEGAREQGFPAALVAGVTTYAYLTHPVVAAWGADWLAHGGGEVRFRGPVFATRSIDCVPRIGANGAVDVEAVDPTEDRNPRATLAVVRDSGPPAAPRDGDALESRQYVLDGYYGDEYGARAGDDLALYQHDGIVHPAVWPAIANNIFSTDLVRGSWIHTRSIVRHHGIAPRGATVDVHAVVVDRFVRHGERVVADVRIEHDGRPIATLEHEAIIDLSVG